MTTDRKAWSGAEVVQMYLDGDQLSTIVERTGWQREAVYQTLRAAKRTLKAEPASQVFGPVLAGETCQGKVPDSPHTCVMHGDHSGLHRCTCGLMWIHTYPPGRTEH